MLNTLNIILKIKINRQGRNEKINRKNEKEDKLWFETMFILLVANTTAFREKQYLLPA